MTLPPTFQFNQTNLQDFETCPRRFKLAHIDRLRWPAIESEPVQEAERLARLGADFHRLVHRHLVGLDEETLAATVAAAGPELQAWWQNYLDHRPPALADAQLYPELTLTASLRGYRLLARFDVLAVQPDGTFLIIDWKTNQHKPPRPVLERRMQTRVYPYLLAQGGAAINQGRPVAPESIRLLYWYARFPDEPELFAYSHSLQQRDEQYLSDLIERIKDAAARDDFPLVEDDKPCRYCIYRSLCDRGQQAGPLLELAAGLSNDLSEPVEDVLALDWDQIAEIQF